MALCEKGRPEADRRATNGIQQVTGEVGEMKNITKLAIVVGLLLQISDPLLTGGGREIGRGECGGGHPMDIYGYNYGWPAPFILVEEAWSCITPPTCSRWIGVDVVAFIISLVAWVAWLNIIEGFWPVVEGGHLIE